MTCPSCGKTGLPLLVTAIQAEINKGRDYYEITERFKYLLLLQVLERTGGNKKEAARILSVEPMQIRRWLDEAQEAGVMKDWPMKIRQAIYDNQS